MGNAVGGGDRHLERVAVRDAGAVHVGRLHLHLLRVAFHLVGRAVNQAVVIAFLGIFAFNYVFTQTLLATHPEISVIK